MGKVKKFVIAAGILAVATFIGLAASGAYLIEAERVAKYADLTEDERLVIARAEQACEDNEYRIAVMQSEEHAAIYKENCAAKIQALLEGYNSD